MNMTSRRVRRLSAGLLAAGSLALVSACGTTSVLNVEVGQCIGERPGTGGVSSFATVDCTEPHWGEIYALPQLPDGTFPGEQAVSEQARQLCQGDAFQSYVGTPYSTSAIYTYEVSPSAETWEDGDREVICVLRNEDDSEVTGSLRGANR